MRRRLNWSILAILCLLVASASIDIHFFASEASAKGGWEYRVVLSSDQPNEDQETLNKLGQEGFELVSVATSATVQVPQGQRTIYAKATRIFYLKRATK